MSFNPGWLSSHPGMTFISVSGLLPVSVYISDDLEQKCVRPGMISSRSSTGMKSSQTHFCSKSCKHLQVKDQKPRWKSSRDEMKVIPGWNSSQDEITHVDGSLKSMFRSGGFPVGLTHGSVIWRHFCSLFSNKEWPDSPENGGYFINLNKARNWLRHTWFVLKGAPPKAGRQKISL